MTPPLPALSPYGAATAAVGVAPGFPARLLDHLRANDLGEDTAFLAWQLAALPQGLARAEREELAALLGRLLVEESAGSTRLAVAAADRALLGRATELVGSPDTSSPLVLDGDQLYTRRAYGCEGRVATRLAARLAPGPFSRPALARAVTDAAPAATPAPSPEQIAAVVAALGQRLGVISGGPGTGKTTTALLLVRSLARLGVPPAAIALAAPTGKAKSRLEEDFRTRLHSQREPPAADRELLALCPEAQTLHHLLGATGGRAGFLRATRDPLPCRAVIVDESSMIDLVLMDRLLDALPDACQLVLLGDADQLASVSAGAVFRDLGNHASRLSRGFRADPARPAGSQLIALAAAVRAGAADAAASLCTLRGQPSTLRRQGAEHLAPEHRDELLRQHHARLFDASYQTTVVDRTFTLDGDYFAGEDEGRLDAALAQLAQARVLCVTRQGAAGVERCNAFLHGLRGEGEPLRPGEPVSSARNDYERGLWNGDQGVAVRARRPGGAAATLCAFRTRQGWLAVDARASNAAIGLGYALTVHKAQGSEYDGVLLLLPDYPCPLLTRELLYTAVSRARESVVVCGGLERFKAGVAAREIRGSGLRERMAAVRTAT